MLSARRTGVMTSLKLLLAATLAHAATAAYATPTSFSDAQFACPASGWLYFSYKCYKLTAQKSWQDARTECRQAGGDLAVIEQITELGFLKEVVSPTSDVHIGLYKDVSTGKAMWVDGAPDGLHLTLYGSGVQTAANQCYYVRLTTAPYFVYNDESCTALQFNGVCQIEATYTALKTTFEEASVRVSGTSGGVYNLTTGNSHAQCEASCGMMNASYGAVVDTACMCFANLSAVTACPAGGTCSSAAVNLFPTHAFLSNSMNSTAQNANCTVGSYFEGSCYWLTSSSGTWSAQQSVCKQANGDLAALRSPAEYSFVTDVVLSEWDGTYRVTETPWIGLHDDGAAALKWTDGSLASTSFTAFSSPPSTVLPSTCIYMKNFVWIADNCDAQARRAVCKSPATMNPVSSYAHTASATGRSYPLFASLESWLGYTGGGYYTQNRFAYSGSNLAYGVQPLGRSTPRESSVQTLLQPGLTETAVDSNSFLMYDSSRSAALASATMDLLDATVSCPEYALQTFVIQCTVEVLSGPATVTVSFADSTVGVVATTTAATTTVTTKATSAATTTKTTATNATSANATASNATSTGAASNAASTVAASNATSTVAANNATSTVAVTTAAPTAAAAIQLTNVSISKNSNFTIEGSRVYSVGPQFGNPSPQTTPQPALTIFIAMSGFDYHGKIFAFELDAALEGSITVVVWRPSCTTGTTYCHKAAACINSSAVCSAQQTFKRFSCTSPLWLSSGKRQCINSLTGASQPAYAIELPVENYALVAQKVITIAKRGYQVIALGNADALEVLPGDYLGYTSEAGAGVINIRNTGVVPSRVTGFTNLYVPSTGVSTFPQKSTIPTTPNVNVGSQDIFLRAHVARYVQVKVLHAYSGVGVFPVNVIVTGKLTNAAQNLTTFIQSDTMIQNVSMAPKYEGVAMFYNTTFAVNPHPGTSVMYHWDFNDRTTLDTENRTFVQHVFNTGGVLNVTVTASNTLSRATAWMLIYLQQEILNESVAAGQQVTLLHSPTIFEASIAAGTNVSWLFETADQGIVYFINRTNDAQVIQLNHTYYAWGNYTMNITIWNLISRKELTLIHIVQEAITGLKILEPPHIAHGANATINITMTNGTDVTYASNTDEKPTRDMQMDWRTRTGRVNLILADYVSTGPHTLDIFGSNLLGNQSDVITFWIDYAITNLSMELNTTYLRPGTDPCLLSVTMNYGSRLQLNVTYGNNDSDYYYWENDFIASNVSEFVYTYPVAGHYTVEVVATNAINQAVVQQNVTVQNPVFGLNLTTNSPQPIYPGGVATVTFNLGFLRENNMSSPFEIPSEAFQLYTFGDFSCPGTTTRATTVQTTAVTSTLPGIYGNTSANSSATNQESTPSLPMTTISVPLLRLTSPAANFSGCTAAIKHSPINVSEAWLDVSSWDYTRFGTYNVALNVSNFVSYMFWNFTIDVDQPVLDLIIIADHYIIEWNTTVNFTAAMTWGSRINLTWNWMDGREMIVTSYTPYQLNQVTHLCDVVGVFFSEVTALNLVSNVTASLETPIIVQYKVQHFAVIGPKISLIKKMTFVEEVHFMLVVEKPYHIATNASYFINFGDGTVTNTSYLEGMNNTEFDTANYSHALSFSHGYLFGGDYTVCITLWNLVSNGTYCFNHTVYDSVYGTRDNVYYLGFNQSDTEIGFVDGSNQPNYFPVEETLYIVVNITRGSHIYYTWDFGDNYTQTYYMVMSVEHKYKEPGLYNITVNASNLLTWDLYAGIVIMQRTVANVSISGDSPFGKNLSSPFEVDMGTMGTDACYMIDFKDQQSVGSRYLFFGNDTTCKLYYAPQMAVGDLRLTTYSDKELAGIRDATNSTNTTVFNEFMAIGVYYVRIEAINMVSSASAQWRTGVTNKPCRWPVVQLVDSNACNNPQYCINGTKAVKKSERLFVNSYVFINCSSSAVALYEWTVERSIDGSPDGPFEIYNDTGVTLASNTLRSLIIPPLILPYGLYRFTLNVSMAGEIEIFTTDSVNIYIVRSPLVTGIVGGLMIRKKFGKNYTFDAATESYDPDNPSNKTGFSFKWLCRRLCQDFPTYDSTYTTILSPPARNNCTIMQRSGIPAWSTDGCFTNDGFDSPGQFSNSTAGTLTVDLGNAQEGDSIEVRVVVTFVGKVFVVTQYMDVTLGEPPTLTQECITNCKEKLNARSRLSLETTAENSYGVAMVWHWRMYQGPAGSSSIIGIKNVTGDWPAFASTGITSPSIALEPGFFDKYPNATHYRYFLQVTAYRVTSSPDNYGTSFYSFELNQPPQPGNCTMNPQNGTALYTTFNLDCPTPFNTTFLPILYEVGYLLDNVSNVMWIGKGFRPVLENPRTLPAGFAENNYEIQIVLRGTDSIGGVTTMYMPVQVIPAPDDNLDSMIAQLVNAAGASSTIQNTVSSGDAAAVASLFGAIAKTMNEKSHQLDDELSASINALNTSVGNWTMQSVDIQAQRSVIREQYKKAREKMITSMSCLNIPDVAALRQLASATAASLLIKDEVSPDAANRAQDLLLNGLSMIQQQNKETSMPADQMESAVEVCLGCAGALMDATGYLKSVSAVGSDSDSVQGQILENLLILAQHIQSKKVPGEFPTYINSDKMGLTVSKSYPERLSKASIKSAGGNLQVPDVSNFMDANSTATYLKTQLTAMVNNPFIESSNGTNANNTLGVSSKILRLMITDDTDSAPNVTKMEEPFHIVIERNPTDAVPEPTFAMPSLSGSPLTIRKTVIAGNSTAFITVTEFKNESNAEFSATLSSSSSSSNDSQNATTYSFTIYIGINQRPSEKKYDFVCHLPIKVGEVNGTVMVVEGGLTSGKCVEPPCQNYLQEKLLYPTTGATNIDPNTCYIPETLTNKTDEFFLYFGITYQVTEATSGSVSSASSSTTRMKRSVAAELTSATTGNASSNSTAENVDTRLWSKITIFAAQCNYWDPYLNVWSNKGCKVGPLTVLNATHCICEYLSPPPPTNASYDSTSTSSPSGSIGRQRRSTGETSASTAGISFGAGMSLPMNSINLSDSAFNHLDENPLVFSVLITIMCLYMCTLIWARRKDLDDAVKAGASPLLDNNPYDMYLYELTIYTGSMSRAGTTAKVSMIIAGDKDETAPRLVYDDKRSVLQRGGVDSFIMAVPRPLGSLSHIRVWHDNGGKRPSWFFSRMQVVDMQSFDKFYFILDRWLAVDEDDGLIDRLVPLAGKDEMTGFNHLFWTKTKKDMFDGHLWFSLVGRPHKSRFTRCQRLTCCMSLLFSCMMINIMFYKTASTATPTDGFSIGPVTITPQMIFKGIISSLISMPVNIIIVLIFRKARTRPMKTRVRDQPEAWQLEKGTADTTTAYTQAHNDKYLGGSEKSLSNIDAAGENKENKEKTSKKKNGKLKFPWWSIFIAYFLSLVVVGISFWYIVEAAGVFGPEKASQWLCSFMISVVESIFLSQPIKVVLLAIFFATVIKKPANDEDTDNSLDKGDEYLHKHVTAGEVKSEGVQQALSKYKNVPVPPRDDYIKAAKEKRLKENKMADVLKEVAFYMAFLYLMSMVAYGNLDPWNNLAYQNLRTMLQDGAYNKSEPVAADMWHARTASSFFAWTQKTMLPALYGDQSFFRDFGVDRNMYLAVPPRLRQLRVSSAKCRMPIYKYVKVCEVNYEQGNEDTGAYRTGWLSVNATALQTADVGWAWQSADELSGQNFKGLMAQYGGGGFAVELGDNIKDAQTAIESLVKGSWLDTRTRAVFVEFVLYNPNMMEFAVSYILFEFLPTGTVLPYFRMHLMRLDNYTTTFQLALLGFQIIALMFIFYFMFKELKSLMKLKTKYFTGFWSIMEFIILGLALGSVVLFFCRFAALTQTRSKYKANASGFVSFKDAAFWDENFCLVLGVIVFCAFIKLLKLLRFNKRISMIGLTLKYMLKPLASFMLALGIIFFAYVQMAYIIFGTQLLSFSTFSSTVFNMITMVLNKINYSDLQTANPLFAPIVFFSFIIGVNFILINFMVTIIMEGFAATVEELKEKKNQFEIVDFMVNKFKNILGYGHSSDLPPMRDTALILEPGNHAELDEKLLEFEDRFMGYCDIECRGFKAEVDILEREIAKKKEAVLSKTIFSA